MHAELLASGDADSSGVSSSAAVGVACLLALEAVNGLQVSIMENVELDRHACATCRIPYAPNGFLGVSPTCKAFDIILYSGCSYVSFCPCLDSELVDDRMGICRARD